MRRPIAHDERNAIAFAHREFADGGEILSMQMHRRAQHHHVGAGDRAQCAVVELAHPGNSGAIAEAQHQLHAHRHAAAFPNHDAHAVRVLAADRHEVDERGGTVIRFEVGFEDQRVFAVAARDMLDVVLRRDAEAAVLGRAE